MHLTRLVACSFLLAVSFASAAWLEKSIQARETFQNLSYKARLLAKDGKKVEAHGRPPAQRFQQSEQRIAVFSAGNGNQDPVALRDEVEVRHGASHVMQKVTFDKLRRPASRLPSLYTLHEAAHCAHVLL